MRNGISCDIAHGCGCLLLAGIIFTLHQQQQLMRSCAVALVSWWSTTLSLTPYPSYTLNGLAFILCCFLSLRVYIVGFLSLSLSLSCLIWFHCALAGISFNSAFFSCFVLVLLLLHFCIILVIFINIYETSRAAWNKSRISETENSWIRFRA